MGDVYQATHEVLGKQVAIKLLRIETADEEAHTRCLKEGITAARVRHSNVVSVIDAGIEDNQPYLVMELLEGESLQKKLLRDGALSISVAVDIILPLIAALACAHANGVLHRDLKPSNIFLADIGKPQLEPMLLDFGVAKVLAPVEAELTIQPQLLGTPLYLSPEQADGNHGSALSDQYGIALTLYECLLSIKPFERYSHSLVRLLKAVAEGNFPTPQELDPSIPDELNQVLLRALSTQPTKRFSNMREFGGALLPFASQTIKAVWGESFAHHEHTMASTSGPDSKRDHSPHISVEIQSSGEISRPNENTAAFTEEEHATQPSSFMSHSSLFGMTESIEFDHANATDHSTNAEDSPVSNVSRRGYSQTSQQEAPNFSAQEHWQHADSTTGITSANDETLTNLASPAFDESPLAQRPSQFDTEASKLERANKPRKAKSLFLPLLGATALGITLSLSAGMTLWELGVFPGEGGETTSTPAEKIGKIPVETPKRERHTLPSSGPIVNETKPLELSTTQLINKKEYWRRDFAAREVPLGVSVSPSAPRRKKSGGRALSTQKSPTALEANENSTNAKKNEISSAPQPPTSADSPKAKASAQPIITTKPSSKMPSGNLNPWDISKD